MLNQSEVRSVVLARIRILLLEETDEVVTVDGTEQLHELAFNSLLLARLIISLEAEVGVDPFAREVASVADIRTANDLVTAYETAVVRFGEPVTAGEAGAA
ncbi:acyl carrier protein [Kitasatospora sp. NPDC006697]|uniref:acyl carrier protein n=1 Tax=Kitasatospora sp. NPDC006697 TaxID=3364020 RepID=UPI0036C9E720